MEGASPRCLRHNKLYEDAVLRQQRLRHAQETAEHAQELKQKMQLEQHARDMRQWRRLYHAKDSRTHLEREEEYLRKKRESQHTKNFQNEREMDAMEECTFCPDLSKGRHVSFASPTAAGSAAAAGPSAAGVSSSTSANSGSTCIPGGQSRPSRGGAGADTATAKLRRLVGKQHSATSRLQALASEEADLQDRLSALRADLRESIQEEETRQVVALLQMNSHDEPQHERVQQVLDMVLAADTSRPEVTKRRIVEELVARSQDEVCRRVREAFSPLQQKAKETLNNQRFAILKELEAIEVEAATLLSTCRGEEASLLGFNPDLAEEALRLGFDPDLAERSRSDLHMEQPGSSLVLVAAKSLQKSPLSKASLTLGPPVPEAGPRSP